MSEILTKARARNVFYGGSLFFAVVFVGMVAHSHYYIVNVSIAGMPLTEGVSLGKPVREARALGQSVHGVVIDADGQDWFARIFGRAGFTLLPDPARLPRALPDIYHGLTRET